MSPDKPSTHKQTYSGSHCSCFPGKVFVSTLRGLWFQSESHLSVPALACEICYLSFKQGALPGLPKIEDVLLLLQFVGGLLPIDGSARDCS